jgi:hypothetical protein
LGLQTENEDYTHNIYNTITKILQSYKYSILFEEFLPNIARGLKGKFNYNDPWQRMKVLIDVWNSSTSFQTRGPKVPKMVDLLPLYLFTTKASSHLFPLKSPTIY